MVEHKLTSFAFQTIYLSLSWITYECCQCQLRLSGAPRHNFSRIPIFSI